MKKYAILIMTAIILAACNHLTREAKQMIGDYYIQEISNSEPILQLKGDGSCVMTAIKPGVLSYSVEGEWNVKNDSLLVDLDPQKITWDGDSSLIADIPTHMSYYVVSFNDITLEVSHNGVNYALHRRVKNEE